MRAYGYKCETPNCRAWIKKGNLLKDSPQGVHLLIELGVDREKIICPDCRQAHYYYCSERKTLKVVDK